MSQAQQHKRKMMTTSKINAEPDDEMEIARSFESDDDPIGTGEFGNPSCIQTR